MSVKTQPLVPVPAKSGKSQEGISGQEGQKSGSETASKFLSVLEGMKNGEQAQSTLVKGGAAKNDTDGSTRNGSVKDEVAKEASEADAKSRTVAFSTSNLADALRKASRNVLASGDQPQLPPNTAEETNGNGTAALDMQNGAQSAAMPAALGLNAVLAVKSGQQQSQVNAHFGATSMAAQTMETGLATGASDASRTGASSLFTQFGVEPERIADPATGKTATGSVLPHEAAGSVKLLRQETHFAPNMRLSPAQQVGDQIATFLKEIPADRGMPQAGLTAKAEGPVLKTLDIQLTPQELGTVKVSLRMVGDSVEVTLVTSRAQTTELLQQDKQLLDYMLRTTGFKADTITFQTSEDRISIQNGNAASNGNPSSGNGSNGSGSGDGHFQDPDGHSSDERPGGGNPDEASRRGDHEKGKGDETGSKLNLSEGIYL